MNSKHVVLAELTACKKETGLSDCWSHHSRNELLLVDWWLVSVSRRNPPILRAGCGISPVPPPKVVTAASRRAYGRRWSDSVHVIHPIREGSLSWFEASLLSIAPF